MNPLLRAVGLIAFCLNAFSVPSTDFHQASLDDMLFLESKAIRLMVESKKLKNPRLILVEGESRKQTATCPGYFEWTFGYQSEDGKKNQDVDYSLNDETCELKEPEVRYSADYELYEPIDLKKVKSGPPEMYEALTRMLSNFNWRRDFAILQYKDILPEEPIFGFFGSTNEFEGTFYIGTVSRKIVYW